MSAAESALADATGEVAALIDECCRSGVKRNALLLAARSMPADLSRPHHLRLAHEALEPLTGADRARVFRLADGSRVIAWRGDARTLLEKSLAALRHLLPEELDPAGLARVFALPRDAELMRSALAGLRPVEEVAPKAAPQRRRLDTMGLQKLEQALTQMDVSRFCRRQRVWRVAPSGLLEMGWEKRVLSVTELAEILAPGHDLAADPWLFRRLTRTLDRRLLVMLAAPDELRATGALSLDLNVATVLAPEFLRFDAGLPFHLRGQLVIELLPADILADAAGYVFAREFLRARRYRVMIREILPRLLPVLDLETLSPDLAEIEFCADFQARPPALPAGPELVLAYANHPGTLDQAARAFAAEHGIRLLAPRG